MPPSEYDEHLNHYICIRKDICFSGSFGLYSPKYKYWRIIIYENTFLWYAYSKEVKPWI